MGLRIVTDSTCDLPPELVERYRIVVIPVWVHFAMDSYLNGVEINHQQFYRKLAEGVIPKSSQSSPGQVAEAYRRLAQEGHSIISIHVTAKVSGMYNSAVLAKSLVPEAEVEVVDSASISMGMGLIVLAVARAIEVGESKGEVLTTIEEVKSRVHLYATVPNLEFLRKSGRASHLQELLTSILDIKPILTVREGMVQAVERVRTHRRSLERILELLAGAVGTEDPIRAAVVHANVPEEAEWLRQKINENFNCRELSLRPAGMALVANAGPGLIGAVAHRDL